MEGTPLTVNPDDVRRELLHIEGVIDVHDLHIWSITSGLDTLSAHLLIEDHSDQQDILQQAVRLLEQKFGTQHVTLQVENSSIQHEHLKV
ncbi:Cadmium, cobalt and zinc/H(+)-K(+) antiporter [compost metagenome]